jgi:putative FmdB family regulatory protein
VPTYEFKCTDCGECFEVTCRIAEREEQAICPKCGERNAESVLSASFTSPRPPKY